ncbi:MAG TPA: SusC/RagA family TonB-linked outer membrane protein [Gemmatimonadales bacterium]|nr:SusC/RagA family TonB-linked outer membrane protein [Gemmatimonadales bacterium]
MATRIRPPSHGLLRAPFLLLCCLVLGVPAAAQAQQSGVGGRVVDEAGGAPLEAARVVLTGPNRIEATDRDGRFLFRNVTPGTYQIRVLRLGYKPATQNVTVAAGETAALEFSLTAAPVQLDEIVTTATGEQRKLEVGNSVATIDAASIALEAPITEFGNLLSGRAAGVQVQKSGGTTGTGTRIRIRGSNSVSLSNEPLYYIDGIRMESGASSSTLDIGGFGQGAGASPSRINDINPDDIESIEIVKGPAAATLYGIQASNGVVRITTKKGRAGRARWNLYSELGAVDDHNTYPINFNGRDNTAETGADWDTFCIVQFELDGLCTQTSVSQFSPLNADSTSPLKPGLRQQYGANVSGGTEQLTYYLSGDYEHEDGVFRLPRLEEDSILAEKGSVPDNQIRPNALERVSLRANVNANVSADADLQATAGYTSSDTRFIENDNSFLTITGSAEAGGVPQDINRGWYFIPAELFAELANQSTERFIGGLTGNWRPASWLSTRATLGYDITNRQDVQFFPTGEVADYLQNRAGLKYDNRFQISQTTVDLAATGNFQLSPTLTSKTTLGGQFFRDRASGVLATGRGLPAGSGTITGAGSTEARDTTVESRSLGSFVEQQFGLKERLFVTGALRFDDNSAFGQNFDATVYPKASVSWLVSDEPFFNRDGFFSTLRLRGAFGASGQQPGTTDALRFFTPVAGRRGGVASPGITFGSLGNADLKPERSKELELGLDASILDDRVSFEFSYYAKRTRDALIERNIPPSLGGSRSQFFNLGEVKNNGVEMAINARVIDSRSFTWDLALSGSVNNNELIELGEGVAPIIFGFGLQRHTEGLPLGGYWSRPITGFADANGDGIIAADEVTVGDTAEFRGRALPNKEASLNSSLTLFNGRIRVGTQFDYRGGNYIDNAIESFRCTPILNCRGLVDRTAPLEEQARAQAVLNEATEWGYFEPGWFIKMRELSLTFFAPDSWARRFRASRLSLTLAGRNLWTITDYSGVDPEVNAFAQSNFSTSDFESQPQVRYWTARLNVGF